MTRVIIIREDENGKAIYLYGGESSTKCLKEVFDIVGRDETKIYHSKDKNNVFDSLKLNN